MNFQTCSVAMVSQMVSNHIAGCSGIFVSLVSLIHSLERFNQMQTVRTSSFNLVDDEECSGYIGLSIGSSDRLITFSGSLLFFA